MTAEKPRLFIFLRHLGCSFAREAVAELKEMRPRIEEHGASLVLVHMSDPDEAEHVAPAVAHQHGGALDGRQQRRRRRRELGADERERLLRSLAESVEAGARVLVIEPISRRVVPWWDRWAERFLELGGRDDRWRFPGEPPDVGSTRSTTALITNAGPAGGSMRTESLSPTFALISLLRHRPPWPRSRA